MAAATLERIVSLIRRASIIDGPTDDELLSRFARQRDQDAFAEIVRRHGPMVLAVCRRILRQEQDAEDAFQATFMVLARKGDAITHCTSLAGWLYQVGYRIALRAKAQTVRRRCGQLDCDCPARENSPLLAALDEELARKPDSYRVVIVLCYFEGKTQAEAARQLATTPDAINSRLKRAREFLRRRLASPALSIAALTALLASAREAAAMSPGLAAQTLHAALEFVDTPTPGFGTAAPATLANGDLSEMTTTFIRWIAVAITSVAFALGAIMLPSRADDGPESRQANSATASHSLAVTEKKPMDGKKRSYSCILLWMSGGPSQTDTFDPKAGNIALFKPMDTNVKGLQFTELFPALAKHANHLAIIRSMSHREGDHLRATYLMRTGYAPGGGVTHPSVACALAKELSADRPDVPRHIAINPMAMLQLASSPGFLGPQYGPIKIGGSRFGEPGAGLALPAVEMFEELAKGKGKVHRDAVAKAFDLTAEKAETHDAYGKTRFGDGCLLARRLIETGVPVVEVTLGGWDTHGNAVALTKARAMELDAGLSALIKDLHERKKLETTLIVWMGEFGRTPRINASAGRDHYPMAFTAMLAGANIKGGQAIGKTSDDGALINDRSVSPQEFLATIYESVRIDPRRANKTDGGQIVPLVERGNNAIKEALR